ncbi:MAG: 6-hydroxymethylpterin diphosphokinase MptE-like protein [Thermincola sp.]|jgi:hypothetical protein|nr:6-hydroxymethylpterin diphosphokinase MptE-like protein [Thermincola sp.]MDT3703381.1 6-hydroxymethylpterin diphosphokinase MptE-like protein [Thermincola sp.]
MNLYTKNLNFFKNKSPVLYQLLTVGKPAYPVKIQEVQGTDNFTIGRNDVLCFANSMYDIDGEMKMMFNNIAPNTEMLVVFGLGTGYCLKYIKENYKSVKHLIIIEPSLHVFKRFLTRHYMADVFRELGNITLLVNRKEEDVAQYVFGLLFENNKKSFGIASTVSYHSLFDKYYKIIKEKIVIESRSRRSHVSTLHYAKYKWMKHTFTNLMQECVYSSDIYKLLKGKPVVIVSAGPSLNKHLHLLEELKKKAVIVAVGSAATIVNNNNIIPHFRAHIEANYAESIYDDHFYETSSQIPLLFASQTAEGMVQKYDGHKIFMLLITDTFVKYLLKKMGREEKPVLSGASVANSTMSFLCEAGCNPIIFLGQDMCYYDKGLYAKGIKQKEQDKSKEKQMVEMVDIFGNKVYALRGYLQIKYDYESNLKHYPNIRFINATEGGLGINGTEIKTLLDVMREDLGEDINIDFNSEIEKIKHEAQYNLNKSEALKEIVREIDEVLELNDARIDELKRFTEMRQNGEAADKLKSEFERINRIEKQMEELPVYKEALRPGLYATVLSLKQKYFQGSQNELEKMENGEKYFYNVSAQVFEYLHFMKGFIENYLEQVDSDEQAVVNEQVAVCSQE